MKADTESWVRYAESDYLQVLNNISQRFVPEGVCYHAQQCVEKYLKAMVEEAGRPIPKTHDLGMLLGETKDQLPELVALSEVIIQLSNLLVVSRYPTAGVVGGDLVEEAEMAEATMRTVRRIVREHFGLSEDPQD